MPTLKWLTIDIGDEVAVMPANDSPPGAVLGIQQAVDVGSVFIQLRDGRMFYRLGVLKGMEAGSSPKQPMSIGLL